MQAQLKDKNDIKIFILYLMRHVGRPLDFVSINDIVVQDGYVGYFDFVECFAELLEAGNIEEMAGEGKEGDEIYRVTEQGAYVVDTLDSRIINNIKDTDQFYQFLNADDPAVARALSIIEAGEAFPQVSEDDTKTTAHE